MKASKLMDKLSILITLINPEHRKRFKFLALGSLFNGLLQVSSIASMMPFLGVAADPSIIYKNQYLLYIFKLLNFNNEREFLIFLGVLLIILIFLVNISTAFFYWLNMSFNWSFNHTLSCRLIDHYMNQDYVEFTQRNSSDLQKNIQIETNEVMQSVLTQILNILNGGMTLLLIMILIIVIQPVIAFIIGIIFLLIYLLIFFSVRNTLVGIGQDSLEDNKIKFQAINEALGSFKIAKLLHKVDYFNSRFAKASKNFSRNQVRRYTLGQIPKYFVEAIAFSVMIGICLLLIGLRSNFSEVIPILGLYAYAAYRFIPGVQLIYSSATIIRSSWFHVEYLYQELKHKSSKNSISSDSKSNVEIIIKQSDFDSIKLDNVSFSYPGSKSKIIDKVSLSIYANTTVGFFGTTGSGKTTIIDLILGLLLPDGGKIYLNNKLLGSENLTIWQKSTGYVPQDIYLIDGTIIENIAFGIRRKDIDFDQIRKVCSSANISSFIENNLVSKYETIIGERGIRLSGGQRQRLGIARALYHNPSLIVFDEATSALDHETEKSVMDALDNLAHHKTIIMVAHRTSTLRKCDNIFRVEDGKIIDSGTYGDIVLSGTSINN